MISDNTATGGPREAAAAVHVERRHAGQQQQPGHRQHWRPASSLGGGLLNHATATLNKTVVSGNTTDGIGGGIANAIFFAGQPTPTLQINNSQITGNSASEGGGIINISFDPTVSAGTVTLYHTTVSSNTPDNCGPGGSIAGCTG